MLVHYSDNQDIAFCAGVDRRDFWMSVAKFPCGTFRLQNPKPDPSKNVLLSPYAIELMHLDGSEMIEGCEELQNYERVIYPFTFWKVQRHLKIQKELSDRDIFVQDYMLHQSWLREHMRWI